MEIESYKEHFQYHSGRHQITQHIRCELSPLLRDIAFGNVVDVGTVIRNRLK